MAPLPSSLAPLRLVAPPMALAMLAELLAWCLLAWPGTLQLGWYGWPGMLVAAHLLGLGTLALSIIGAGWQLLTVVSTRPLGPLRTRLAGGINLAAALGVSLLITSFWRPGLHGHLGAVLAISALLLRSLLVLPVLLRAPGRRALRAWLIGAELSLWAGLTLAAGLYGNRAGLGLLPDQLAGIRWHASLLLGGWVGGWIIGLGGLLLPMFAVAEEPDGRAVGAAGLLYFGGLAAGLPALWAAGAIAAASLLGLALHRRIKPALGPGLALAGAGLLGLALSAGLAGAGAPPLVLAAAGFSLFAIPLLRGVAARILPFLAWAKLFGGAPDGAPPVAALVPEVPVAAAAAATALGGLLLTAGLGLGQLGLASSGAGALALGALGHALVAAEVMRRAGLLALRRGGLAGVEVR